jgi:guanosine-3',5'-bis(diphosphate) 3'-pyrophosphohydrolase
MARKREETAAADPHLERFISDIVALRPGADRDLIKRAYLFSAMAHEGQMRLSGAPYLSHCVETARILAELNLDSVTIVGGLLHDIVEDTSVALDEIRHEFGDEVANIVDGVTHISEMSFESPEKQQMENYRKMLLSMAEDVRVILIKIADRLHNMRTLQYLPDEDRRRISRETLDVFAPLAHRLGIAKLKWELEDLSLKYLDPEAYELLSRQIAQSRGERERYIEELTGPLLQRLKENGIAADVEGRAKHFYSIYMKMQTQGRPIEDIFDLLAVRVITDSVPDCYKVLGVVHSSFTPVIDRIKDFIATPKHNMYRSLHTTVIGPRGEMVEIQIRTKEMHKTAEEGIAAHWRYKEGGKSDKDLDRQLTWLRQTLEWLRDFTDPDEFLTSLKADLYHNEIFVFTPKGDLKNLPMGATPIDFAYAVHTEVGQHCVGAKVNGKLVPFNYRLKNGDTVEILTQKDAEPNDDWLKVVATSTAKSRIKRWLKSRGYSDNVELGKEMLDKALRRAKQAIPRERDLDEVAQSFGKDGAEQMLAAVGLGEISVGQIIKKAYPEEERVPEIEREVRRAAPPSGVRVEGMDNIVVRFAKCCQPVPGDDIVGIVTKGRGISVHRSVCPNVVSLGVGNECVVKVEWDTERKQAFPVNITVTNEDRRNMLAEIAKAISDENANILSADVRSEGVMGMASFLVDVHNLHQLDRVVKSINRIRGVHSVTRKGDVPSE